MTTGWIVQYRHLRYEHSYEIPWTELIEVPTREQALKILHQLEKITPDYEWTLLEHRNGNNRLILVQLKDNENAT
jgi:hypothetical protein